jgi:membrane peptidoglycan carboxypeptidase
MYEHANGEIPSPNLKVGVVSIDPATGGIVSMYGGRDFLTDQINRATRGTQQAGSTFKPFTLIAGLENGVPLTKSYPGYSPQEFGDWKVNNFGFEDFGTIDLVKATEQSVNTVYAQLNLEVGPEKTAEVAQRAGVKSPVNSERSNVLGTDAVTTLDMASAYATIAAQGVYHKPFMVAQATYPDGDVAYSGQTQPVQQFEADVMADTTYAMTQVVEKGSGRAYVKPLDRPIAGKTGTSNDNKSAWFVGFTPQIATAVSLSQVGDNGSDPVTITPWGEDASGRSLTVNDRGITGATWPAAVWADYMGKVFQVEKYAPVVDFPERANVNRAAAPTSTPTTQAPVETQAPEPEEPTTVAVPSISTGMFLADVQAALTNAGLVPNVVAEASTEDKDTFLGLNPGSGTEVPVGSTVTIRVSDGSGATPDPNPAPADPANPGTGQAGAGQAGGNGQAGSNQANPGTGTGG